MIRKLDTRDLETAEQIVKLQKASYIIEAKLIEYMQIPPLLEHTEDITNSVETYYGYFMDDALAGIISYTVEENVLDICKVAVHPDFFKRGVATKLLRFVEQTEGIKKMTVSTGLRNDPAVNLYTSLGFIKSKVFEVREGLFIVSFEKSL